MGCCCKKNRKSEFDSIINQSNLVPSSHSSSYESPPIPFNAKLEDFKKIKVLGKGSFGKVVLVKLIPTNKMYAMKILKKRFIVQHNQVNQTMTERAVMEKLENPFIVKLHYAFQDIDRLYFITDFLQGGELFFHLKHQKNSAYQESDVIFYSSEILLAIEYMHEKKCLYRDLKPENILLDKSGHIRITDFGLSKILQYTNEKTYTMCGTPGYLAPEILANNGYSKTCDWFSFGVLIYKMITGNVPFEHKDSQMDIKDYYQPIRTPTSISYDARDIIEKLLEPNPSMRLGCNGSEEIKKHSFFSSVDFEEIKSKKYKPPFVPSLKNEEDLRYFFPGFKNEQVDSISTNKKADESFNRSLKNDIFKGFSYQPTVLNKTQELNMNPNERPEPE